MEGTWSLSVVADYWLPVGFGRRGIWVGAYIEGPITPARDPKPPVEPGLRVSRRLMKAVAEVMLALAEALRRLATLAISERHHPRTILLVEEQVAPAMLAGLRRIAVTRAT